MPPNLFQPVWDYDETPLDDLSDSCFSNLSASQPASVSFEQLNHADVTELMENSRVVPADRRYCLRTAMNKIHAYPQRFARDDDNYRQNVALVAASGWDLAKRYSLCGVRNAHGHSQACRLWNLCPACSYWKRKKPALDAYLTRFKRTSWFLVTIAYQQSFGDGILDDEAVRLCWHAASQALYDLQRAGCLRGTITRSELHLESFLPLLYFPHTHSVVDADEIDCSFLGERVFAYRCPGTGGRIDFPVSIKHRRLDSRRAFANALSYLNKALDLARPYEAAWPKAEANYRQLASSLNQEVDELLDAFSAFVADAHQVRYTGSCHAAAKNTVRIPSARRRAQRNMVNIILMEDSLDEWDEDDLEPARVFDPPAM